jgi:hypothetical protein
MIFTPHRMQHPAAKRRKAEASYGAHLRCEDIRAADEANALATQAVQARLRLRELAHITADRLVRG